MAALHDGRGLALTTANPQAVEAFEHALEALLGAWGGIERHVDEALRRDAHFVLARCMRIAMRLLHGAIEAATRDANFFADEPPAHANDRERGHILALQAWLAGQRRQASRHYDELLARHPLDILALHVALALDFRIGSRPSLRDRVARVLPHWHTDTMHYGYLLGMQAFGLEENGEYAEAAVVAHRSLAMIPDNAAALHVIAHVFEMQGRAADGIRFLEQTRPTWSANAGFAVHIAWHLALFHVDRGSAGDALLIYDRVLRPSRSSTVAALVDSSALLWRLELRGAVVGRRFGVVARGWRRQPLRRLRAFDLIHAMVAFVGAGLRRAASRLVQMLRADPVTRAASEPDEISLAIPFCEALQAFAREDYRTAAEKIAAVREQTTHCGGQRRPVRPRPSDAPRGRTARTASTACAGARGRAVGAPADEPLEPLAVPARGRDARVGLGPVHTGANRIFIRARAGSRPPRPYATDRSLYRLRDRRSFSPV